MPAPSEMAARQAEYAVKFGKPDLERLGLFIEMDYMNGTRYKPAKPAGFKGKNMLTRRHMPVCGNMDGYFSTEFVRLFEGEAIPRRKKKKPDKKKILPFVPVGMSKKHSCPGDYFGTFGGFVRAFAISGAEEGELRKKPKAAKKEKIPRGAMTCPGKKGGYGYVDICLSPFPEYTYNDRVAVYGKKFKWKEYGKFIHSYQLKSNFYPKLFDPNPFVDDPEPSKPVYIPPKTKPHPFLAPGRWVPAGPSKWQGGCHAGLFALFPEYMSNRNKKREDKIQAEKIKKAKAQLGTQFRPQATGYKTMMTSSIVANDTNLRVNFTNYKFYEPIYTKRLLAPS